MADDGGRKTDVLLLGGAVHGARLSLQYLPMTLVVDAPRARQPRRRSVYVHQYEIVEQVDSDTRLVAVYAPADLPHEEVLRLARKTTKPDRASIFDAFLGGH